MGTSPPPRPSSPTTLFRQLRNRPPIQTQSDQPSADEPALLMPLSATTGALRPPQPPLPPTNLATSSASSASAVAGPRANGSRTLRSRPTDVDELGRKPGTVDLPGGNSSSSSSSSASKRRKVDLNQPPGSKRRVIPPPPPLHGDDPDAEAEDASEYNCPVCLCPPTQAIVTPCGHLLCFACLQKSLASNLVRTQQHPARLPPTAIRPTPLNLEGDCPVCRVPLPGGLFGKLDRRTNKTSAEGVRRIEVKLVDVRPAGPPIELE